METVGPLTSSRNVPSVRWSLYVGGYALLCAAVLLLVISQVATLVSEILALPTGSSLWLAVPVPVFGAAVWWQIIEQRNTYSYLAGGAAGLATGLLTVLFWVLRGALVWGVENVFLGWPLIVAVLVPTVPVALLAGASAMYGRRRLGDARPDGER